MRSVRNLAAPAASAVLVTVWAAEDKSKPLDEWVQ